MKIHCTTTFLDGRDRFEEGDVRVVDDDRAAYFIAQGWASADGSASPDSAREAADLVIDKAQHAHKERQHG